MDEEQFGGTHDRLCISDLSSAIISDALSTTELLSSENNNTEMAVDVSEKNLSGRNQQCITNDVNEVSCLDSMIIRT